MCFLSASYEKLNCKLEKNSDLHVFLIREKKKNLAFLGVLKKNYKLLEACIHVFLGQNIKIVQRHTELQSINRVQGSDTNVPCDAET